MEDYDFSSGWEDAPSTSAAAVAAPPPAQGRIGSTPPTADQTGASEVEPSSPDKGPRHRGDDDLVTYLSRGRNPQDERRQRMYDKAAPRVYGYRAPRLHEQRQERRYLQAEEQAVSSGPAAVVADEWNSRVVARKRTTLNARSSVFEAPHSKPRSKPPKPVTLPYPKLGGTLDVSPDPPRGRQLRGSPEKSPPTVRPFQQSSPQRVVMGERSDESPPKIHQHKKSAAARSRSPSSHTEPTPRAPDTTAASVTSAHEEVVVPPAAVTELSETRTTLQTATEKLHAELEDLMQKKAAKGDEARKLTVEDTSADAALEPLRAEARAAERQLFALQARRKSAAGVIREAALKEKQAIETEKMIRAVRGRLERAQNSLRQQAAVRADQLSPQRIPQLPQYPAGSDTRARLRIAGGFRVAALAAVQELKDVRSALQEEISLAERHHKQAKQVLAAQEHRRELEEARLRSAVEGQEIDAISEEMRRARDNFELNKAHRLRTARQQAEARQAEIAALERKAHAITTNQSGSSKTINDLLVNVAQLKMEEETKGRSLQAHEGVLATAQAKVNALTATVASRTKELQIRQRELAGIAERHKAQSLEAAEMRATIDRDIRSQQAALETANHDAALLRKTVQDLEGELLRQMQHRKGIEGTMETAAAKMAGVEEEVRALHQAKDRAVAAFGEKMKAAEKASTAQDAEIEQHTKRSNEARAAFDAANTRNSRLLEHLDVAERLSSMYNLR